VRRAGLRSSKSRDLCLSFFMLATGAFSAEELAIATPRTRESFVNKGDICACCTEDSRKVPVVTNRAISIGSIAPTRKAVKPGDN
jgi:hypothetical protein